MKSKNILCGFSMAVVLHLGVLAGSAQTNTYLYSGSETNITLNPGTYIITAYGAPGGPFNYEEFVSAGLGAEMSAEFDFSTSTNLTLLVGGGGGTPYGGGGGGGGGSFVVEGSTPLVIAGGGGGYSGYGGGNGNISTNGGSAYEGPGGGTGGGLGGGLGGGGGGGGGFLGNGTNGGGGVSDGGSIIDSSAIAILTEVSGTNSPDDSVNGEIIIIGVPTPLAITPNAAFGFTNGVFGFNVTGPSGSNVVIQASADLHTWIPLQTNLLGSGPLYFSDPQSPTNARRFYRAQLSP